MFEFSRLAWVGLFVCACSGPGPADTGTKPDDDDGSGEVGDDDDVVGDSAPGGTDSGPTVVGDPYLRIYYTQIDGNFGFSPTQGLVNAATDQGEIEARIEIWLGAKEWSNDGFASDSDHACVIYLYLADGPTPAWAVAPLYYGVDWDPKNGLATSCIVDNDKELDPLAWGYPPNYIFDDPKYFPTWGIGVGPAVAEYVDDIVAGSIYEGIAGGGYVENTWLPRKDGGVDGYWASGIVLDDDGLVEFDEDGAPVLIDAADWPGTGAALPHGLFFVTSSLIWNFGESF